MTAVLALASILVPQTLPVPVLAGLWDFAAIYAEPGGSVEVVEVHLDPLASSAVVARLDKDGIVFVNGSRSCSWMRDLDRAAAPRGCVFTESGYEVPSLAVFERRGDWLRIALENDARRFGWVQEGGRFHALANLLGSDNLTYLTAAWNGTLYDGTGPNASGRQARRANGASRAGGETPYRGIGHAIARGRLWLHIEVLDNVCGAQEPRVVDTGWIPAQSATGAQWAWFRSRGC